MTALQLPGTSGNYASTPDSAALSITSDIDLRIRCALNDWTPSTTSVLFGKDTSSNRSYVIYLPNTSSGLPTLGISAAGSSLTSVAASVAPTIADGAVLWLRATWRDSDDRVQFFTAPGSLLSPVAADFTQLGTDKTAVAAGIFDGTAGLEVGSNFGGSSNFAAGKFYRAQVFNGIDGTLVYDAEFAKVRKTATRTPTSFTESSSNAATVTINGSAWDWVIEGSLVAMPPCPRRVLLRSGR